MKKKFWSRDRMTHLLFTVPAFLAYAGFFIWPVIMGMYYSLTDWNGTKPTYEFIGIRNYVSLTKNPRFFHSLTLSLKYALMLVVVVVGVALILALSLNALKRFKTFAKSIFFFPAMISSVAIALIWDQLFYRMVPEIGKALHIGILSQSVLADPKTALFGVLFVHAWQAVAMPAVIFLAGLQSVPEELYESAMMDGATSFKRFCYITLPYLIPTITVNTVLTLKSGITTFDYVYALTGGGPMRSTEFIGLLIYNEGFQDVRFALANAEAVVLFVIIAVFSFLQMKVSNRASV